MENRDYNIFANILAILVNLFLGVKLFRKSRTTDSLQFQEAFGVVRLTLTASMIGAVIFLVLYVLRLLHVIDDHLLQGVARLVVLFFYFFVPSLLYFSLQAIKD